MTAIVTLTMNPALDVTVDAPEVVPDTKIRCRAERLDAGGGGVNVARFAHVLGAPVSAVLTAGGSTGSRVVDLVTRAGVPCSVVGIGGTTRESLTVDEASTDRQYRFVLPGPRISYAEQQHCLTALRPLAASADFVVASGSLPPGVPPDFYQRVADLCARAGARLILDTSGGGLSHVTSGVFLVKPSVRELHECVGRALSAEDEQVCAARELVDRGIAEAVVVSLGAQGALLATATESLSFPAVPVRSVSGVGAGDALVAGIVVGLTRGWALPAAVRLGMATAAAKLGTAGTAVFNRAEVDQYLYAIGGAAP